MEPQPQPQPQPQPAAQPLAGPRILVTGVTGYVGGRVVPRLLEAGYRVRVMVRGSAARLTGRPWLDRVEVVVGDVLQPDTLPAVMEGVEIAYYLIHSMGGGATEFAQRDIDAARAFGTAARDAGVTRIIYLGGLGDDDGALSEHLRSRQATGDALREAGVPVTEFRAGMVVGSGSISFEMLRALCERLPVMLCPQWVFTRTQPIAIRDLLAYLVAAPQLPASAGEVIEIGGADVLTYGDMMLIYARLRGLQRWLIPVPVLTPGLSAYWVHWFTPVSANLAHPLIEGLRNELVVRSDRAQALFPTICPMDYAQAVDLALRRIELGEVETIWSDALVSSHGGPSGYLTQEQGMLIERRELEVNAPPEAVYRAFAGIGGARGWPAYNLLWLVRGVMDRAVGGVGFRRGRRHPDDLRVGDALDFWRVEAVEPGHKIVLRAEMKLPGQGWLQFEANPGSRPGTTQLVQTAYFAAKGLFGLLYWYAVYPLHGPIFSKMAANIARQAEGAPPVRSTVQAIMR
jgi:uncharacterized protein YbjT (DUF2867 family)/uncharacterized protein YndB with AHSA1/START domain